MLKERKHPSSRCWGGGIFIFLVFFLPAIGFPLSPKDIYQKVGLGVVLVLGSDNSRTGSGGTGSIIHPEGLVITNAHVVISKKTKRPYKKINIFLKPNRVTGNMNQDLIKRFEAQVLGFNEDLDLALLKIERPPQDLNVVAIGNPEEVSIGEPVVAIGHPETGGLWTLTTGAISAEIENFNGIEGKHIFQTETSFNRGNSGGPLLDERGYMIGINTSISRRSADGLTITDINFSVKSSVARDWLSLKGIPIKFGPVSPILSEKTETSSSAAPLKSTQQKLTPKTLTRKRPYLLNHLIADQMKEMEDLMDEMRKKFRNKIKR